MSPDPLEGTLNIHLDLVLVNNDPGNLFTVWYVENPVGGGGGGAITGTEFCHTMHSTILTRPLPPGPENCHNHDSAKQIKVTLQKIRKWTW